MTVSVIIPTYNGAHKVIHMLHSLEKQIIKPAEVIVVVDGSTDGTATLLKSEHFELPGFKIIEQPNGGRAKVRNRGAAEAKGALLIFFDDDMYLLPGCIEEHIKHHQNHPGTILTGGLSEEVTASSTDIQKYKSFISNKWNEPLMKYADMPMNEKDAFLTAANLSMSKELFFDLQGFDEKLTDAEDYDLSVRAKNKGIKFYFNIRAFAWHNDFITCRSYIKRLRQYAQAQKKLQQLKPELYDSSHKYATTLPKGTKAALFKLFCKYSWIKGVDKGYFRFLPRRFKYKLYDIIITANGIYYPEKVAFLPFI